MYEKNGNRKFVSLFVSVRHFWATRSSLTAHVSIAPVPSVNNWFTLWKNVTQTHPKLGTAHASRPVYNNTWFNPGRVHRFIIPTFQIPIPTHPIFVGLIFGIAFDQNVSAYRIDSIRNTPSCLYTCHQCLIQNERDTLSMAMPSPCRRQRRKILIYNKWVCWCQRNRSEWTGERTSEKHKLTHTHNVTNAEKVFSIEREAENFSRGLVKKTTRKKT